jgi:sulfatase modifying factor 1
MDNLIAAPHDPLAWPAWRQSLANWRDGARADLACDGTAFGNSAFAWVDNCIVTHKILLWDERFYDREAHAYRVEAYVDAFKARFGQLDGVILWHAYPNIGFDARNQFDFYRRMPGGLAGLRDAVDRFHARGVRVLLDFNPWDRATRREDRPDHDVLAELVGALDADGLYLDTMAEAAGDLRAALDAVKPGVVFESQSFTPLDRIADHHMSWAEVYEDGEAPGVLRNAWFERGHRMHVVHRWVGDHRGELQLAWMNGQGMVVWENVFGSWNGWSDRDAAWLRLMGAVQHRFARLFRNGVWTPLAAHPADGIYASCWEGDGLRLWTLVNRRDTWWHAVHLETGDARRCVDLFKGRPCDAGQTSAAIDLPPHGLGAILECVEESVSWPDEAFLEAQAVLWQELGHAADTAPPRSVVWKAVRPTVAPSAVPDTMARVSGGILERRITYRRRECGLYESERAPACQSHTLPGLHERATFTRAESLTAFAIDRRCVSNCDFATFLAATAYAPRHSKAFLEHWSTGVPPSGEEDAPVVWIDLEDARAYAAWLGRRLPREAEWQRAAELGLFEPDARVWNWTESEGSDGRTRFCILKGGSAFKAGGTAWYADGGEQDPGFAARYLLLWPGLDRCGSIGFRTVVDLVS